MMGVGRWSRGRSGVKMEISNWTLFKLLELFWWSSKCIVIFLLKNLDIKIGGIDYERKIMEARNSNRWPRVSCRGINNRWVGSSF